MENLNILSAWWFMFFLLILVIGYFIVEILFWEKYFLRKILVRNENHVLDRVIHYVIWWVIWNILFSLFLYYTNSHIPFLDMFEYTTESAEQFSEWFWVRPLSYQLIYFSIFYLWFFMLFTSVMRFCIPFIVDQSIENFKMIQDMKKSKKKKKSKKNSKKKNP